VRHGGAPDNTLYYARCIASAFRTYACTRFAALSSLISSAARLPLRYILSYRTFAVCIAFFSMKGFASPSAELRGGGWDC